MIYWSSASCLEVQAATLLIKNHSPLIQIWVLNDLSYMIFRFFYLTHIIPLFVSILFILKKIAYVWLVFLIFFSYLFNTILFLIKNEYLFSVWFSINRKKSPSFIVQVLDIFSSYNPQKNQLSLRIFYHLVYKHDIDVIS